MTNKKMTDEEFRNQVLSSLSELNEISNNCLIDFEHLQISLMIIADHIDMDPAELAEKTKQVYTYRALKRLEEKEGLEEKGE